MDRVVIFIDGSNFYHGMKINLGEEVNINFQKFVELLCGNRILVRVYYYNVSVRREDGEERYKAQQKFRDIYDTAILVSGDGDFVSVTKAVKDLGKHVENVYFWKGHSDYLYQECDKFVLLTKELLSSCIF